MLKRFLLAIRDIVYPKICLACKEKTDKRAVDNLICSRCWQEIKRNTPPFCYSCGRTLKGKHMRKNICANCVKQSFYFDRAFSPCVYTDIIQELIHQFKYKGKDYLARPLSRMMIDFIREFHIPIEYMDYVMPMPLHSSRLRWREFNQAEMLGRYIAEEFNKPLLSDLLVRRYPTLAQAELMPQKRISNVKGCFKVKDKTLVNGKKILLVDDVLTTGATSSEAAFTLKDAGANIVFLMTLAS
ncbi:MAG: ComF family protein [Candidatus Omnitrophica bacterium]|nr:ComF family protein [Candidatus Omnitrophota bacterium]